jgi:hypothetical protein
MVMAELAGAYEAPIYGILDVDKRIVAHDWGALARPIVRFHGQPEDESEPSILWDGEWEITYVTFRDMGAAFAVAIVGIYILVVAQFGSFKLPLVILTPIPLTLIGIVLGHWMFGAPFTATSMIGFIALAGIIVRNSILLVDFIRHGAGKGKTLREAVLRRCINEGLVGGEGFAVDASLIKAEANRQKGIEGEKGLPPGATGRAVEEYLAVLDDAAFGAATVGRAVSLRQNTQLGLRRKSPAPRPIRHLGRRRALTSLSSGAATFHRNDNSVPLVSRCVARLRAKPRRYKDIQFLHSLPG